MNIFFPLAISSALGQLLVWEWQSESYVLKQQGHYFDMNTLAYAPDGQNVATGGDDGKVKIWNTVSGFCFVTFSEHSAAISAVEFAKQGQVRVRIASQRPAVGGSLLLYAQRPWNRDRRATCLPVIMATLISSAAYPVR